MFQPSVPLRAKNPDGKLRVIVIGRISTEHQKEENIEASFRYVKEHLARMYDGPIELECLGERASGMLADRATIRRAEELITSGRVDVVVAEDLSRIYRNPRLQFSFVQDAVDQGCRVICLGDNLDTATDHWEVMLGAAAFRHGTFIPDVRRRVRRTATHAFHNGGMVLRTRYGYRKLSREEAANGHFGPKGLRIAKLAECTETIRQICRWVREGVSYVRIAERLDQDGICPGLYVKHERWTAATVVNLLRDPILSGIRRFRVMQYEPIFGTGKHRRRKGDQPETKTYPELAHLSVAEQEDLWRAMDERAVSWQAPTDQVSKRLNVPRSKALWPGQAATCGICSGRMYDLGRFLKCRNALPRASLQCWNHVQAPLELTRRKVVAWLLEASTSVPGALNWLADQVWVELERTRRGSQTEVGHIDRRITELQNAASNLAKAIAKGGDLEVLVNELAAIQGELNALQQLRARLVEAGATDPAELSRAHIAHQLDDCLCSLLRESYEFGDVFRTMFSQFRVVPVQAFDTPAVRPRARLTLELSRLGHGSSNGEAGNRSAVVDLFEPPEHIRWIDACAALKEEDPRRSLKDIASRLGIGHMTVKRALGYARLMQSAGSADTYRELCERPAKVSRWHPRGP